MFLLSFRPWSDPDLAGVDAVADVVEAEVATAMAAAEVAGVTCLAVEAEVATDVDEEEEASAEAAVVAVVDSKSRCTSYNTRLHIISSI